MQSYSCLSCICSRKNFFIENGNFWFLWTDFFPRGVACLTLIYLMFYKPIKLNLIISSMSGFASRDKSRSSSISGTGSGGGGSGGVGVSQSMSSSNSGGARYRDDADIEEERGDIENPLRPPSGHFNGKRSSMEMRNTTVPPLMTEFFRESEDFDKELEMAMDSR